MQRLRITGVGAPEYLNIPRKSAHLVKLGRNEANFIFEVIIYKYTSWCDFVFDDPTGGTVELCFSIC